jgi:hypothetical protein
MHRESECRISESNILSESRSARRNGYDRTQRKGTGIKVQTTKIR